MTVEAQLVLLGAGIALVADLLMTIVRYFLGLKEDSIKRQRDQVYKEAETQRKDLLEGVTKYALGGLYGNER